MVGRFLIEWRGGFAVSLCYKSFLKFVAECQAG